MVVCKKMRKIRKSKSMKTEEKIKCSKLRKEECCEDFRRKVRAFLGHVEEFLDDWETTATVIRETGKKVCPLGRERKTKRSGGGIMRFRRVSREEDQRRPDGTVKEQKRTD